MKTHTKITITEASRLAGISRTSFYKTYINKGIISVIKDDKNVFVDVSELLRVFPDVNLGLQEGLHKNTQVDTSAVNHVNLLERENQLLKNQLKQAEDREDWLKSQIDELRHQQSYLLEDKNPKKTRKKLFGIW